jgi:hypothetical protein
MEILPLLVLLLTEPGYIPGRAQAGLKNKYWWDPEPLGVLNKELRWLFQRMEIRPLWEVPETMGKQVLHGFLHDLAVPGHSREVNLWAAEQLGQPNKALP